LILDTFDQYAAWEYASKNARRSYKHNTAFYFSLVDYWFASFRIMGSIMQHLHRNYISRVLSVLYPTTHNFYTLGHASNVFRSLSTAAHSAVASISNSNQNLTLVLRKTMKKHKKGKCLKHQLYQSLENFCQNAPEEFWNILYNGPSPSAFIPKEAPQTEEIEEVEEVEISSKPAKIKSKKPKVNNKKKKGVIREQAQDEFMSLFQKNEEELALSLKESQAAASARLAMVTSLKPLESEVKVKKDKPKGKAQETVQKGKPNKNAAKGNFKTNKNLI
jgi:hypothetical protein